MLFKFNALMRRDYKDDYSPYSFSFDMSQDASQYPDTIGNISHGMYITFCNFISIVKKIAEVRYVRDEDEEYDDSKCGLPLSFKNCSIEIEDGIEKLGLYYINDEHKVLTLLCNDQAVKIRYDLIVESEDKSTQVHCGIMARVKCPNICDYLANHLALFMMADRNVQASDKQHEILDEIYDSKSFDEIKEHYSSGLAIVLEMTKTYDVILINCRTSGDIEDPSTYEWLYDRITEYKDKYGFKNRFVNLNFIRDDDFNVSCKFIEEDNPFDKNMLKRLMELYGSVMKEDTLKRLIGLHDTIVNSDSDDPDDMEIGGATAIPLEEGDTPDDIRAKIKAALDARGIGSIVSSDELADKIMEARENQSSGGIYFGSVTASSDGTIGVPDGISLSAEDINYFVNELHNTDKPHALIRATLDKIRENPGLKNVSDELLISILKEAIIEYADPEIMSSLDNFKPDEEDE